jgi:PrtD family type I secretion system ABC transporter
MAKRQKAGEETALAAAWRASFGGLAAVFVFTVFINLLKFATPLYLLQVLDRVPASRSIETLVMLTVITLVAVACGMGLEMVRRRMLARWGVWIEDRFGPQIVHQSLSNVTARRRIDPDRALGDLAKLRGFVTLRAASWLDIVWVPAFLLGIFLIHPVLGTVAVCAILLLILLALFQEWTTRDPRRASSDAYRESGELMLTAERNKESVQALSMAQNLTERWRRTASGRLAERERIEARSSVFNTLMRGLGEYVRIAMIAFGVWLVLTQSLTVGGIFAARIMAGFAFRLVERAVQNWRSLLEALRAYRNLKDYLADAKETRPSVLPGTSEAPLILDLVSFRYSGQRDDIFRRLSLELAPGEMLVVTGTATTGKSTLSRLLVGLVEPRYGQVRFGDIEVARLPDSLRSGLIGYLPQHTELFTGTVRENIARMGDGPLQAVVEATKLVGIHDLIVHLPQGYDTEISADTLGLSGSERKRIAMARAFFRQPRLIVLDEPSANLDSPSRRIMEAALKKLKADGCTIVVTQAIQSNQINRLADKFLILGGKSPEYSEAEKPSRDRSDRKANLRSVK